MAPVLILIRDTLKVIDISLLFSFYNADLHKTIGTDYWGTVVNLLIWVGLLVGLSMVVEAYLERHEGKSVWFGIALYGLVFLGLAAVIYFKWV